MTKRFIPVINFRKVFPNVAASEIHWFLSGSQRVSDLGPASNLWASFTEADGETVQAAYGYRWRHHFGTDQIHNALEALRKDPSNRRVVVNAWDPYDDTPFIMPGGVVQKNVPCPTQFILSIVNNRLNMSVVIRSSDVFVGLPYDVMGHALIMDLFLMSLREKYPYLDMGVLHFVLAHAHLYAIHEDYVHQGFLLQQTEAENHEGYTISTPVPRAELPGVSIAELSALSREAYVLRVRQNMVEASGTGALSSFHPKVGAVV